MVINEEFQDFERVDTKHYFNDGSGSKIDTHYVFQPDDDYIIYVVSECSACGRGDYHVSKAIWTGKYTSEDGFEHDIETIATFDYLYEAKDFVVDTYNEEEESK